MSQRYPPPAWQIWLWPIDWILWRIWMLMRILTGSVVSDFLGKWAAFQVVLIIFAAYMTVAHEINLGLNWFATLWILGVLVRKFGHGHDSKIVVIVYHMLLSAFSGMMIAILVLL